MVKVISSCLVAPEVETPKHGVWLSNLDLFQAKAHTPTVYFYKPNGDPGFFSPEALKAALAKALVPFYLLAGRLGADGSGRVEINCNAMGVLFVEAESELTVDKFGDFTPSPENRRLLIPTVNMEDGDDAIPLLLIQVTFFKCGGVCLGVGLHHYVSDGVASLHFINAWSDAARGSANTATVSPFLDRTILRANSPPTVLFPHVEYQRNPSATTTATATADKKHVAAVILKLLPDNLHALKTTTAGGDGKVRYTTYESVAAHVWRCACEARGLVVGQESRIYITADARHRLRPPIRQGYIGNAIFTASAAAKVGEVLSDHVGEVAGRVRRAIGRLDDEYLRSALDFLEEQEDLRIIGRWAGNFPATDLSVVSWTRLPIYAADFGWGRPVFMGPASLFYAGLAYIMPNPSDDGGLSIALSLESECIARFKELFYNFSTRSHGGTVTHYPTVQAGPS